MAKYSFEQKLKIVQEYQAGGGGYGFLANKYGVADKWQVKRWVEAYHAFGADGLRRSRKKENYSFDFKLHVVELYLTTEISYQELALQVGLNNPPLITKWVNDFRIAGADALKPKRKRRCPAMNPQKDVCQTDHGKINAEPEYLKRLEEENLKLRIENAYLKELRRLRLEEETLLKKQRESSTASGGEFKLKDILAVTGFPKATYMYWQKRFERENPDQGLENKMLEIHEKNKDYGYRRMCGELRNQGYHVNKKKVQRIMHKLNLQVTSFTRKSRKYSSYKGRIGTVAPNRIRRRFHTHIPHQKITTDTTEFKYYEVDSKGKMTMQKLYLDPFMDMCNGEIISFGIDKHPSAVNIMNALNEAIKITSDCPYRRTFHSDQGWAYQMKAYSNRLKEERIFQSMSRKGNCYDNSVMENFFGLLKQEIYYGVVYYSYEELKAEIERYIKYYNEQRIKEKLGWMSPVKYRINLLAA